MEFAPRSSNLSFPDRRHNRGFPSPYGLYPMSLEHYKVVPSPNVLMLNCCQIWHLQLPTRQKLAVSAIFLLGFV